MKVITWFYSNTELLIKVTGDDASVSEESSEDESDEDENSDGDLQVQQVIYIR